jgi:dihydrodipicolinate synthase/N-acetylneuraminate lyase
MLNPNNFKGPWAGLPVAWTDDDQIDEAAYREDVRRCCQAGVPGVYSGGTSGEFYAQEMDDFKLVARATVEECHSLNIPAMVGVTSISTRGACLRAAYAASIGADAIQVALPFWMEVPDDQVVPFFKAVADAAGGLALSIYETERAKKTLTLEQHQAIKKTIPLYLMVKANGGTLGYSQEGCQALSELVNVFVSENRWDTLCPLGATGCCSALIYWNPRVILTIWELVEQKKWEEAAPYFDRIAKLLNFLFKTFGDRGWTDSTYDATMGIACGFLTTSLRRQGPYPHATEADVQTIQQWLSQNDPEMLIQ